MHFQCYKVASARKEKTEMYLQCYNIGNLGKGNSNQFWQGKQAKWLLLKQDQFPTFI